MCADRSLYPLQQTRQCHRDCPGDWTSRLAGQWSDCLLTTRPQSPTATPNSQTVSAGSMTSQSQVAGMLRAAEWNCGIGRRYHSIVCYNSASHQTVSPPQCGLKGVLLDILQSVLIYSVYLYGPSTAHDIKLHVKASHLADYATDTAR